MPIRTIRVLVPDRVSIVTTAFQGIRVATRAVGEDFTFLPTDFLVLVDASLGPVTGTLPFAVGEGQWFYCKKIDATDNVVTIMAQSGDLIDDSILVALTAQWNDCGVIDAAFQYWDLIGGGG